jgi:hypothetical protein
MNINHRDNTIIIIFALLVLAGIYFETYRWFN